MSRSSVKSSAALTTAAIAAVTLLLTTSANAQVNVAVFSGYNDNGSDITFSGPVSSFTSPDIAFATNLNTIWIGGGGHIANNHFGCACLNSRFHSCINLSPIQENCNVLVFCINFYLSL
jgi:hypothetical protein